MTELEVDIAVDAARQAFRDYSKSRIRDRIEILSAIADNYTKRRHEIGDAMIEEMGVPKSLAYGLQTQMGLAHFETARDILRDFSFETMRGSTLVRKEPIGVCAFITPWNWPMNQIACKAAPSLATGCTFVWKPSEEAPFSAQILTEVFEAAGVPPGVANVIHGSGPKVGAALAVHKQVDMVSFTGSTRAGVAVAVAAAATVKRVSQELGGKSANIILDDLDNDQFEKAVAAGIDILMMNSGQNCNAPSRMLVPADRLDKAISAAVTAVGKLNIGDPKDYDSNLGPVVSSKQFAYIQNCIKEGVQGGAEIVAGGLGRPEHLSKGYYVKPTVFKCLDNKSSIVQKEIFGPVAAIIPYESVEDAVRLANDCEYGLSGYVFSENLSIATDVARQLRAGMVHINGVSGDMYAPFGGYKMSGNGREWGEYGFDELLEVKAIMGCEQLR